MPVHKLTEKGIHSVQLPVCLPHELLPWLMQHNVFPEVLDSELKKWWAHASALGLKHAGLSPTQKHHPCYVWGDDCVYNEHGEKLICICMGFILDERKNSLQTCFPLFVLREEACHLYLFIKLSIYVSSSMLYT